MSQETLEAIWETVRNNPTWILAIVTVAGALVATVKKVVINPWSDYYRKKRNEKQKVRSLLTFLESHRVLQRPYSTMDMLHPVQSAESVQSLRKRLSATRGELPEGSQAAQPIRGMHNACLKFLTQYDSRDIPRELPPEESEEKLFSLVDYPGEVGRYAKKFRDALMRMQAVFDDCMDELYEQYDIERPPPHEIEVDTDPGEREPGEFELERSEAGLQLLRAFNNLAEGSPTTNVAKAKVAHEADLDSRSSKFRIMLSILEHEGYVQSVPNGHGEVFRITAKGIQAVARHEK